MFVNFIFIHMVMYYWLEDNDKLYIWSFCYSRDYTLITQWCGTVVVNQELWERYRHGEHGSALQRKPI